VRRAVDARPDVASPGRCHYDPGMLPFTGQEFLESLRDGREIWIYGQRVDDVTTHPAFRNPARMLARLYDALHDAKQRDVLTCPTDTGSGGFTHRYFRAPASADELVAARDAIAGWARMTYGWMGRSPDYKAAFLATLAPTSTRPIRTMRGGGTRRPRSASST
jgi:4-hydroxyphenylacetate 3-monooxygenase